MRPTGHLRSARAGWLGLVSLVFALAGCGPDPEAQIAGRWAVDTERWLADERLAELPSTTRATLGSLAGGLVADLHFSFGDGQCRRTVAGRTLSLPCRVHTAERGTVVLRATAADGVVEWLRITPAGPAPRLEWGGRTLPIRRQAAGSDVDGPQK